MKSSLLFSRKASLPIPPSSPKLSRTVKGLKCYPTCKLTIYPPRVAEMLVGDLKLQARDERHGSPPGSPIPGILQARTLEWVAISFSMKDNILPKATVVARLSAFSCHFPELQVPQGTTKRATSKCCGLYYRRGPQKPNLYNGQ